MRALRLKVKSYITSSTTAYFLGVAGLAAPFLQGTPFDAFFPWVVGGSVFIMVLYFLFLVPDLTMLRRLDKKIEYTEVSLDWRVNEQGDFEGLYQYTLRNNSRLSVEMLPREDLMWFSKPDQGNFTISISPENADTTINGGENDFYHRILRRLANKHTYSIAWDYYDIDPPLRKGQKIKYSIQMKTLGTEHAAFTDEGTYAGIPAGIPIRKAKLSYSAPLSLQFNLLVPLLVVDNVGARNSEEEVLHEHELPVALESGSVIQWELSDLKAGLRYWFKYRLEKKK